VDGRRDACDRQAMGDEDRSLPARCEALLALHRPGRPLVLPNAWDVASARAVVEAGFPAVATSSGAIAVSLGFEDEGSTIHRLTQSALAAELRRIADDAST